MYYYFIDKRATGRYELYFADCIKYYDFCYSCEFNVKTSNFEYKQYLRHHILN